MQTALVDDGDFPDHGARRELRIVTRRTVEYRRALKELKANADAEPKIAIGA